MVMKKFFKYLKHNKNMKKERLFGILFVLILIAGFSFIAFPKTGFVIYQTQSVNTNQLENLRIQAKVECLQNLQCSENQECMGNICIEKNKIDICQNVGLSTSVRSLKEGDSINSVKGVLTKVDLPYLLSDGELVEIVDKEIIEYFYSPVITIGNNKIEKENGEYIINNNESVYTYKLTFSNPIDFSNKNFQGQTLRILGEEYMINKNSDNLNIELISKNKNLILKNSGDVKITKDENGNIISIEIYFNSLNKIKVKESYSDSLFNKIKLSFDNANNDFTNIKVGENC